MEQELQNSYELEDSSGFNIKENFLNTSAIGLGFY